MGVMWDKSESPALYRTGDTGGVGDYEFTALHADYEFTKSSWSTRLSQIETAGYATQSWTNQTFATAQSVSTQLQSYLKTTDLNSKVTETSAYQTIKATTGRYTRVIGSTDAESRTNIAQIVMTDSVFNTRVTENVSGGINRYSENTVITTLNTILTRPHEDCPNGFMVTGRDASTRYVRLRNVVDGNGWYTVSGYFRGTQNVNISIYIDI